LVEVAGIEPACCMVHPLTATLVVCLLISHPDLRQTGYQDASLLGVPSPYRLRGMVSLHSYDTHRERQARTRWAGYCLRSS